MLVNQKITALRKDKGMSMSDLAAAAGVTQTSVSRYESGKIKKIDEDKLVKIARALGVSLEELVGEDPLYRKQTIRGPYIHGAADMVTVQDDKDKALLFSFHNLTESRQDLVLELSRALETGQV